MGRTVWLLEGDPPRYVMEFPSNIGRERLTISADATNSSPLYCVRHYFGNDRGLIEPWMIAGNTSCWISFSLPEPFLHCPADLIDARAASGGHDLRSYVGGALSISPSVLVSWFDVNRPDPTVGIRDREAEIWWVSQRDGAMHWDVSVEHVGSWAELRDALLGRVRDGAFPPHLVRGWSTAPFVAAWI